MTHFGENIEYIEYDPVNSMVLSDLNKTLSILNYPSPKFQSYEKLTSQTQEKDLTKFQHQTPLSQTQTLYIQFPKKYQHQTL